MLRLLPHLRGSCPQALDHFRMPPPGATKNGPQRRRLPAALWMICAALSLGAGWSRPAWAQAGPDELARRHFESGAAYFEQAEYDPALREFRKAYELSGRPQILRNISVVEERLGRLDVAVEALDQYLAAAPDDPDIKTVRIRRDNLAKRLEQKRLEQEQAELEKTEAIAAAPVTTSPVPASPPSPPAELPPPEPMEAPASPPDPRSYQPAAYWLLGIAGLSASGAVLTGVLAQGEHDSLSRTCAPDCAASQVSTGERLALASTAFTGAALLSAGVSVVLFALSDADAKSQGNVSWLLDWSPSGGSASAQWSF